MKCEKCGRELNVGEKFCNSCGEKTGYADMSFSKITFKRDSNFYGCAIPFKIFIDGEKVGSLTSGGKLSFDYPCGEHEVSINSVKDKSKRTITLGDEEVVINVGTRMLAFSFVVKGKIKSVN